MSNKNAKDNEIEPIIFLNAPIKKKEKDAIGITSSVEMIKTAINSDAKMIGVIAEYGAGKSSLTELLAKSKDYKRIVRINMWDSIGSENNQGKEISNLSKSFIYQLARGISKKAASYVNKILNNNYGIISFSVGYKKTWLFFALAVLCITLYLLGENIVIKQFVEIFGENSEKIGMILDWLSPIACVMGISLAALGIYFSSFVFSSWKESNKRQTGINEVFAAYSYLFDMLLGRKKPTLVIIDDLDRIEEKELILGFLKELYRFNNLCSHKRKKEPVFLISIAPEANLKKNIKDLNGNVDDNRLKEKGLYSKLFDFVVSLKPVHYDDYRNVVSQIIENEPENKKRLNELLPLGEKIEGQNLPEAFNWLFKGENLTLRELKERLNQAISLLVDLRNKDYDGSPFISFNSCVGVTYLERTHPEEFYKLLKKEKEFSKVIQDSYIWRNVESENSVDLITERLNIQLGEYNINKDIATLIFEGIIDTDYRMYFYSFPKGSYIKDLDEKDVCNYLEFPKDYPYERSELNEKIKRLDEKEKLSTIYDVINRISKTKEISYFPEVVFDNKILWLKACEYNLDKTVSSYINILDWQKKSYEFCCDILQTLAGFELDVENTFWKRFIEELYIECGFLKNENIIKMRKALISEFPERVLELNSLFIDEYVPIISMEEVEMINDASKVVYLVNIDKIDKDSYKYVQKLVLEKKMEGESLEQALIIQKSMLKKLPFIELLLGIYNFMYVNCVIDDEFFSLLCEEVNRGTLEKEKVFAYVNALPSNLLTDSYLERINRLCFCGELKEDILVCLNKKKFYTSWLLNLGRTQDIGDIEIFEEDEITAVLEACKIINGECPEAITNIRAELVKFNGCKPHKGYYALYSGDYEIISVQELSEICGFEKGLRLIDASKFTTENVSGYIAFINRQKHEGRECFLIFDWLFNPKYDDVCTDEELISFVIENLDFSKIIFNSMSDEDINSVVDILRSPMQLTKLEFVKKFMQTVRCLIREFELKIVQTSNLDKYISYVNEVNLVSDYTIEMILQYPVKYKLNTAITQRLLEIEAYKYYVVGKTLYNENFEFPMIEVPDDEILSLYNDESIIFNYYIENQDFLEWVMENALYRNFTKPCSKKMLEPFMKLKQTGDFFEFVLETLPENEIKIYLKYLNEIAGEKDSITISQILTSDKYIKYLTDDETFRHIEYRLWDNVKSRTGYKGAFTRKRNAYKEK